MLALDLTQLCLQHIVWPCSVVCVHTGMKSSCQACMPVASFAYLVTALKVVRACLQASLRTKFLKGSLPRQAPIARMQQLVWVHPREMSWPWQWQVTPRISADLVSIHKQQFVCAEGIVA